MRSKATYKFFVYVAFSFSTLAAYSATTEGRVVSVSGNVTINGIAAKVGDLVPVGARFETAGGASASVLFGQESVMNVSANSRVSVETVAGNQVIANLERGEVDGVKKTGSTSKESITIRTTSAAFELTAGRFSVKEQPGNTANETFLAMDGNAKVTYNEDSSDGRRKAGTSVIINEKSLFSIQTASGTGTNASKITTQKVSEQQGQARMPSASVAPSATEQAFALVKLIADPRAPLAPNVTREPASQGGASSSSPSASPAVQSPIAQMQPNQPGQLTRDPGQQLPGRAPATVSVVFQP